MPYKPPGPDALARRARNDARRRREHPPVPDLLPCWGCGTDHPPDVLCDGYPSTGNPELDHMILTLFRSCRDDLAEVPRSC
jgi:hypothetical protein